MTRGAKPDVTQREARRLRNRRAAMIWMLHAAGATYSDIAGALGLSKSHTAELGGLYTRILRGRSREAADWIEPWARRLRAEGAIR